MNDFKVNDEWIGKAIKETCVLHVVLIGLAGLILLCI